MRLRQVKVCVRWDFPIFTYQYIVSLIFMGSHLGKYTNRQPWIVWGSSTSNNLAGDSTGYWVEGGRSTQVGCRNWQGEIILIELYS